LANLSALKAGRDKDGYLSNIFFTGSPLKRAARARELRRETPAERGDRRQLIPFFQILIGEHAR
jgi:hypothetical protein